MVITNEEGFQIFMILGQCFQNFRAAERLYAVRFPQVQPLNHKSFERLAQRVRNEGTVQPSRKRQKENPRDVIAPDVVAAMQMNRQVSTRELASEPGVSHMFPYLEGVQNAPSSYLSPSRASRGRLFETHESGFVG